MLSGFPFAFSYYLDSSVVDQQMQSAQIHAASQRPRRFNDAL